MRKGDIETYRSIGICPYCHKEKLFGEEKMCLECRAKQYTWQINWRRRHPTSDCKYRMAQYYRRIELHQCVACGEALESDYSFRMCPKCRQKNALRCKKHRITKEG